MSKVNKNNKKTNQLLHRQRNKAWFDKFYSQRNNTPTKIDLYFFQNAFNLFRNINGYDFTNLGSILDLGCGTGWAVKLMGENSVGVDISIQGLLKLKNNGGKAICADIKALPFKNGAFDLIYGNGILHHVDDLKLSFKELFRVCKPGGYLLIGPENQRYSLFNYFYYTFRGIWKEEKQFWKVTKKNLYRLAHEAGAENIIIRYLGWCIFGLNGFLMKIAKIIYLLPQNAVIWWSDLYFYCEKPKNT